MQILSEKIWNKIKNTPLAISILINLIAVLIIFLLFEPTMKSDDYDMCNLLYGGVDGKYQSQLLYCSIIWGKILFALLNVFPNIAWYTVLQYILIIGALIFVDMILLEKQSNYTIPLFFLSLFLSYEFMIRFTFSKTAGILMVVGYVILFNALEQKGKIVRALWGCFFLFMGIIIRLSMNFFLMISVVFFGALIILCIKLKDKKLILKRMVLFGFVEIILLGMCWGITKYSIEAFGKDEQWKDYLSINSSRAAVVDYVIPDYLTYEEEYIELGISYNDYIMWFKNADRGDSEKLTQDMYEQIAGILKENKTQDEDKDIVTLTAKSLLKYLENNTVTYVFIIAVFAVLFVFSRWNIVVLGVMLSDFVFCYGYMLSAGRIQHHVDAVLMLGIVFVILYFADFNKIKRKEKIRLGFVAIIICIVFLDKFSSELLTNSYYGKTVPMSSSIQQVHYKNNYRDNSLMSNDKEHLYVVEAMDTNNTYPCFLPLEIIEKKFYSNIYRQNMNHIKIYQDALENYGIDNLYEEMTDSDVIYYVTSDYTDSNKDVTLKYIQENYNPNAKIRLVKKLNQLNIYQFYDEFDLSNESAQTSDNSFQIDINEKLIDNTLKISGYAYQEDTNSYLEKVYVKVTNNNDESSSWHMAVLSENNSLKDADLYNGLYSEFECEIDIGENEPDMYSVDVYLENENGLFLLK